MLDSYTRFIRYSDKKKIPIVHYVHLFIKDLFEVEMKRMTKKEFEEKWYCEEHREKY